MLLRAGERVGGAQECCFKLTTGVEVGHAANVQGIKVTKQPPETMTSWYSTVFHAKYFLPYCTGFDLCLGNN